MTGAWLGVASGDGSPALRPRALQRPCPTGAAALSRKACEPRPGAACRCTALKEAERQRKRCRPRAAANGASPDINSAGSDRPQKVIILGGTGRVGSSTAAALLRSCKGAPGPPLDITLVGRRRDRYEEVLKRRPELSRAGCGAGQLRGARFAHCDIDDAHALEGTLAGADLVVHAAGPFQWKQGCGVLEAALATNTPYMDVCDDTAFSQRAKGYAEAAERAGVPAITTAGIYPGVSNLMAAHMISIARREYDADWAYIGGAARERGNEEPQPAMVGSGAAGARDAEVSLGPGAAPDATPAVSGRGTGSGARAAGQNGPGAAMEPLRVRYSYYTAGSGGVGPTILETSLLLASQPVLAYADGREVEAPPISSPRVVDFGRGIGERTCWLYNLPEVASTHQCLGVPSVSARFATAPAIWNWAMVACARLAPEGFLADRSKSKWLARLADPWVRIVDPFVGEAVGMRVDVELSDGSTAVGVFVHKLLSESVGMCVSAFARAMLAGQTQPGVWFPEEPQAIADRRTLLNQAAEGTSRFVLNQAPWQVERDAKQLGMGMYW